MKFKFALTILSLSASVAMSGFSKTNFVSYSYKYSVVGLTRHRSIVIPIWDDKASWSWLGYPLLQAFSEKGVSASFGSGMEWIGLTSENKVRSLWLNKKSGKFGSEWVFSDKTPGFPKFEKITSSFIDDGGHLLLTTSNPNLVISGLIDPNSGKLQSWKSSSPSADEFIGVTGVFDQGVSKVVTITVSGSLKVWSSDLSKYDNVILPTNSKMLFLSIKSDGKLDQQGKTIVWAQSKILSEKGSEHGFLRINLDPISLSTFASYFPLRIPAGATVPGNVHPIDQWDDFVPFYAGENQLRLIAIANDRVHVFSESGYWIESPWGSDYQTGGALAPNGPLYLSKAIMTSNNRINWKSHQDVVIADDFRQQGHGLQRLSWTPDGFSDYLSLDVKFKEMSSPGETMRRPQIMISNQSATRQLADFKIRLWYSRQNGYPSQIVAERFYVFMDSSVIKLGCSEFNPNLCWSDIVSGPGEAIDPGASSPADGIQLGLHYADWKAWPQTNDYSWRSMNEQYQQNPNITIYTKGIAPNTWVKIWGNEPANNSVPYPYGWNPGPPPSNVSASLVLSMDNLDGWGISPGVMNLDFVNKIQGSASINISTGGWNQLESRPFEYLSSISRVVISVKVPDLPTNVYWSGQIQLYVESASRGLFNQWVGQVDLTSFPKNQWKSFSLPLSSYLAGQLLNGASDLVFRVILNTPYSASNYMIDKIEIQ